MPSRFAAGPDGCNPRATRESLSLGGREGTPRSDRRRLCGSLHIAGFGRNRTTTGPRAPA